MCTNANQLCILIPGSCQALLLPPTSPMAPLLSFDPILRTSVPVSVLGTMVVTVDIVLTVPLWPEESDDTRGLMSSFWSLSFSFSSMLAVSRLFLPAGSWLVPWFTWYDDVPTLSADELLEAFLMGVLLLFFFVDVSFVIGASRWGGCWSEELQ